MKSWANWGCMVNTSDNEDNTMNRAGILPLNLCKTETVLKPCSQFEFTVRPREFQAKVMSRLIQMRFTSLQPASSNEQVDSFSVSDSDSDSEEAEVDRALAEQH